MCALEAKDWDLPVIPAKSTRSRRQRREDRRSGIAAIFGDGSKHDTLYERLQEYREDGWRKILLAFEANPDSPYNAYYYVANHPMFWSFKPWHNSELPAVHERHLDHESGWTYVQIDPHMVNPADDRISDDPHLNTKLEWWYEFGPTLFANNMGSGVSGHDHELDGGAATYDEAIVKVAKAIHETYGNDRKQVVEKWKDPELPTEG